MNHDDSEEPWNRLAKAARTARAGEPPDLPLRAPEGFVSRMRVTRERLWTFAKTYLWRRWSLIAVAVALFLYLVAHLILKEDPAPTISPPQPPTPLSR